MGAELIREARSAAGRRVRLLRWRSELNDWLYTVESDGLMCSTPFLTLAECNWAKLLRDTDICGIRLVVCREPLHGICPVCEEPMDVQGCRVDACLMATGPDHGGDIPIVAMECHAPGRR